MTSQGFVAFAIAVCVPGVVQASTPALSIIPPIITPQAVVITFGPNVSAGKTFSTSVIVTDPNGGGILLTLTVGSPIPASITGLAISPSSISVTPANFQVSGSVAYQPFGSVVTLPLTASNGATASQGSLVLTIVPEPGSLSVLGLGVLSRRRRSCGVRMLRCSDRHH